VTINLVATGNPGTHLIDLYPAIYRGRDRVPWNHQTPFFNLRPRLSCHGARLPFAGASLGDRGGSVITRSMSRENASFPAKTCCIVFLKR
jgi:hypothetical protein